jgi:hypothetical protein
MSVGSAKVITTLRDRQEIEQEIREMLHAHSESEFSTQAQHVAARGDPVISVILRNLDQSDPRFLSALGAVASFYPDRPLILDKLHRAAADINRPDRGRLSAMLIMERFLGQEPDPYLVETLNDPQKMAVESVREMVREGERDPMALIEYASSLADQAEETFQNVIETLVEEEGERAVPVLCLLAQEQQDALAQAALEALGRLSYPRAAQGLQSILPMLRPALRPPAERSLLKLRLKQVPIAASPPMDDRWRCLVSPIDGEGNQTVWFIGEANQPGVCRFLGMTISDDQGISQAYGRYDVPAAGLPRRLPMGHLHRIALSGTTPAQADEHRVSKGRYWRPEADPVLLLLEADLEYGRRLTRAGQESALRQQRPLPVEYRLLGSMLWQYADAAVATGSPPANAHIKSDLLPLTADLLSYPAFQGWCVRGDLAVRHAATMMQWMPTVLLEGVRSWAVALAGSYFGPAMLGQLHVRLEAMEEWLGRAGEIHLAELTACAAATVTTMHPEQHPFTLRMAELGLYAILDQAQPDQDSHEKKEE